ncbi:MAG: DUF2804 domain-containing protein [Candidatus Hermodarchaeota archaeon]
MQNEITNSSDLLNDKGSLIQRGWARDLILNYNREKIGVGWHRIKEWDYYAILTPKYGITITAADLGIMGLFSVVWLDFDAKTFIPDEETRFLTKGKTDLPRTSKNGDLAFKGKKLELLFKRKPESRILTINFPTFNENKGLKGEIILFQDPNMDSIVVATPWKRNPHAFYYNQKINCMPAEGTVYMGDQEYSFSKRDSFGVLDWGRGVWTYKNTWYWGSASGLVDNIPFGFNIGYGFGDTSAASENTVFYNKKAHKLDQVTFHFDPRDYLLPWKFTSNDGRFEMDFKPLLDRNSTVNLLIFKSVQHQVFGYFTGHAILDDGQKIQVKNLLGFAEKVYNRW